MKISRGAAACLLGALLSACGGGGGGGDPQAQAQSSGAFAVSYDRSALNATMVEGDTTSTMTIVGQGSREPDGPLYVGATAQATASTPASL